MCFTGQQKAPSVFVFRGNSSLFQTFPALMNLSIPADDVRELERIVKEYNQLSDLQNAPGAEEQKRIAEETAQKMDTMQRGRKRRKKRRTTGVRRCLLVDTRKPLESAITINISPQSAQDALPSELNVSNNINHFQWTFSPKPPAESSKPALDKTSTVEKKVPTSTQTADQATQAVERYDTAIHRLDKEIEMLRQMFVTSQHQVKCIHELRIGALEAENERLKRAVAVSEGEKEKADSSDNEQKNTTAKRLYEVQTLFQVERSYVSAAFEKFQRRVGELFEWMVKINSMGTARQEEDTKLDDAPATYGMLTTGNCVHLDHQHSGAKARKASLDASIDRLERGQLHLKELFFIFFVVFLFLFLP